MELKRVVVVRHENDLAATYYVNHSNGACTHTHTHTQNPPASTVETPLHNISTLPLHI